jgi:hypothetical protein
MYDQYLNYIRTINKTNFETVNFKSTPVYTGILEHVSYELGVKYLSLIENEFNNIDIQNIIEYLTINDKYGFTNKQIFSFKDTILDCSPSSLRYIYHSLLILEHYKNTSCKNIVEVGGGYGGLCLAINYFSKLLNIPISTYNIIDLPDVCNLISLYLDAHKSNIHSDIVIHDSNTFGSEVNNSDLFFISNYCYTEINADLNAKYTNILLPKASHGFIIWQNNGHDKGRYPVNDADKITGKSILKCIEEKPQTNRGYDIYMNYFVYF